jgi:hypothetical protein
MVTVKVAKNRKKCPFLRTLVPKVSCHVIAKSLQRPVYCNVITMSNETKINASLNRQTSRSLQLLGTAILSQMELMLDNVCYI